MADDDMDRIGYQVWDATEEAIDEAIKRCRPN